MSYRKFTRPISTNWTTRGWLNWAMEEGLLLDVRTDIPEGVCAGCYGGTDTGYQTSIPMPDESGFPTHQTVVGRWPRCYPCNNFDGLDGFVPISYSIHDRCAGPIPGCADCGTPTPYPYGKSDWSERHAVRRCAECHRKRRAAQWRERYPGTPVPDHLAREGCDE